MNLIPMVHHPTNVEYSPHDQLPSPLPSESKYLSRHFYENTAKHLVKDFVRIMNNGLHIDLTKVEELELTLDKQLLNVAEQLANNPIIREFQLLQHNKAIQEYIDEQISKLKSIEHFYKQFKSKDIIHRSYFMYCYAIKHNITQPETLLEGTSIPKWESKLVKRLAVSKPLLQRLLNNELTNSNPIVHEAMSLLAKHKAALSNKKYEDRLLTPEVEIPPFNPNSSKQKQDLFEWLNIKSEATSKETGLPSWDRDQITRVNKETTNNNVRNFTQAMIDQSFAAIVRNNFIEAFYKYTINDRLYGQYKLFGTKTFRPTSNSPNMLNAPSTGSVFAKPLKSCFTAPKGRLIASIDYSALEDRVIANLTKDKNKIILQTDTELDGHLFHAVIYFKEEFESILGTGLSHRELTIAAKLAMDAGNTRIKELRQLSKNITFGLSYGAYPPKVAASIKCPISQAEQLFNVYHNEMYPQITEYRENYVLPTSLANGNLHLGLGCYISSSNPNKDIRTLANATVQFWSILTLLAVNKIHQLIDKTGLQNNIIVTSTIYDAIYFEIDNDPVIVKWLNDNIIPIMTTNFIPNQIVLNDCDLCIGTSWANYDNYHLPHNASLEEITTIINSVGT